MRAQAAGGAELTRRLLGGVVLAVLAGIVPTAAPEADAGGVSVVVTPSTGLPLTSTVQVQTTGFPADSPIYLSRCVPGPTFCLAGSLLAPQTTSGSLYVTRNVDPHGGIDCALPSIPCVVRASSTTGPIVAESPITFTPNTQASVTVTPNVDLTDGASVRIAARGLPFVTGQTAFVQLCAGAVTNPRVSRDVTICTAVLGQGPVRRDGTFVATVALRRIAGSVDCASPLATCVVRVVLGEPLGARSPTAPVRFREAAGTGPAIELDRSRFTGDSATTTVSGRGWQPRGNVSLAQCFLRDCYTTQSAAVDTSGRFSTTQSLVRSRVNGVGVPVPCTPCELLVFDANMQVTVPITFDREPTVVTDLPAGPVGDGHVVNATVARFLPNAFVGIYQCPRTQAGLEFGCMTIGGLRADNTGAARFTATIRRWIVGESNSGIYDCGIEARACELRTGNQLLNLPVGSPVAITISGAPDERLVFPYINASAEGDTGTTSIPVPVSLVRPDYSAPYPAPFPVVVEWEIAGGSGTAGVDYRGAHGYVTIPPGTTTVFVGVPITADTVPEDDEYVVVGFREVLNARVGGFLGLGIGVIVNDD
jgi:hypothetical protein